MKHACITGGSSGIGVALAEELARRGWAVSLLARRRELLEANVRKIEAAGGQAIAVTCDVTDQESVRRAVSDAVTALGPIDLAIANAGMTRLMHATKFSVADAELVFRTNVLGVFYFFGEVIPSMIERHSGRFVGIASLAGLRGLPYSSVYSSSKAALQAFLEASRIELAPQGVAVTIVNPGFVVSEITAKNRFRMPFLMSAERAARIIANGIEAGDRVVEFPLPMKLVVRAMRLLPDPVYDFVMSKGRRLKMEL